MSGASGTCCSCYIYPKRHTESITSGWYEGNRCDVDLVHMNRKPGVDVLSLICSTHMDSGTIKYAGLSNMLLTNANFHPLSLLSHMLNFLRRISQAGNPTLQAISLPGYYRTQSIFTNNYYILEFSDFRSGFKEEREIFHEQWSLFSRVCLWFSF